jgi:PIN domain nuclease of toxin-antitoxin system
MNIILDTHIFIWAFTRPEKLSKETVRLINNPKNKLFLSCASIWECAFLAEKKENLFNPNESLEKVLNFGLIELGVIILQITPEDAQRHFEIQPVKGHSDLFDRMILAQAASTGFTLISYDRKFPLYKMVKLMGEG